MPTYTTWKTRSSTGTLRGASPVRPVDWIERVSPGPFETSAVHTYDPLDDERSQNYDHRLQGLGLSHPQLTRATYGPPDHLYFDQNGGAHVGARGRSYKNVTTSNKHNRSHDSRMTSESWYNKKNKGHTRSGSTIDDLANAAIATSPQFSPHFGTASPTHSFNGSPITLNNVRPATSYINGISHDLSDRPAKRIKSERLYPTEWSTTEERPKSSYDQPRQEDAELLLGLRMGFTVNSPLPTPAQAFTSPRQTLQAPGPDSGLSETKSVLQEPFSEQSDEVNARSGQSQNEDVHMSSVLGNEELEIEPAVDEGQDKEDSIHSNLDHEGLQDDDETDRMDYETHKPPIQAATGTAEHEAETVPVTPVKKQRKIKPEVQEVCASCKSLQIENNDEESTMFWLGCEACKRWFHYQCAGFKDRQEARSVDKYVCKDCEVEHGQTTFVRKSSRARTAIDYAGLNEGVVKSSEETTMHHYVPKFKDGSLHVLPDDFARVRPELMTEEFWENMDGMKRPFVVPACWNPRFGDAKTRPELEADSLAKAPTIEDSHMIFDSYGVSSSQTSYKHRDEHTFQPGTYDEVVDVDQDYLDMVMPRNLTVRKVAELYGPEEPVPVIDVKSQETKGKFTLEQWANYYEEAGDKPIRNVISLEVSNSRLGRLIRRPKVVRDIDLEDQVWDAELRKQSNKRPVQFYCLMSVGDSFTDFHIDFGGSSVYYHILKGVKTFFFIPPEDKYLKKYEEWCLSDQQNETWLGDLCGGNVTRVDLHEGDTAFIPAGWIHSVWTPEDSLVIGGNFLTRYDYELQLRVANIEKVTKVSPKYRYPFFQKVMWYALIKYLEEDPLPEDVIRDFQDNPEYRYIRANPIWLEYADSALAYESGEAGFNSRSYSKTELHGLPALRDYLYRTARIHSDLPVEGITKKQIDAVKASIPKGHGDPMQLAKLFAVWCAWKMGNEKVPHWVYEDTGLLLELERREKEKAKKPEPFRVPPERVSARQKAQASATPDRASTPTKQEEKSEDGSAKKVRSGSKGSGTRLACESCRKRRIKCRHKDEAALDETAQQTLERPRSYSNVGVDIAKLARASPMVNSTVETSPVPEPPLEYGNNSDLAQAALARLQSQSSEPSNVTVLNTTPSSTKKGRSKACEECRKSKRRCVHDEYGRIDPAKAAEPSKPRGSSTSKRPARLSDENSTKRVKAEVDPEQSLLGFSQEMDIDAMIDPALMGSVINDDVPDAGMDPSIPPPMISDVKALNTPPHRMDEDEEEAVQPSSSLIHATIYTQQSPTQIEGNSFSVESEINSNALQTLRTQPPIVPRLDFPESQTPDLDKSFSPITANGTPTESIEKVEPEDVVMGPYSNGSRRSSRQPQQTDRYIPEPNRSPTKFQPQQKSVNVSSTQRRDSSVASPQVDLMSIKSRRSSSNTSGTTHRAVAAAAAVTQPPGSVADVTSTNEEQKGVTSDNSDHIDRNRGSTVGSEEEDADEKLARELQAAEHGLRRRASVRA